MPGTLPRRRFPRSPSAEADVLTVPRRARLPSSQRIDLETSGTRPVEAGPECQVLLRKEVIQPHLPVRLPCYDFTPIASPTFDGSPPCGLGHRLRVLPTFVV